MDPLTMLLLGAPLALGLGTDIGRAFGGQSDRPGFLDMIMGRSARVQDPYYGPSGQAYTGLAEQLAGGMGALDIAGSEAYQSALQGLQGLLSGETLSAIMAPGLRLFQEQIMPQTAASAMGQGMSRGRSALPAYLTQAGERMGMQALSQQAQLAPQALQSLLSAAMLPAQAQLGGLGALGQARGTMVQQGAVQPAMGALGSSRPMQQGLMALLQGGQNPQLGGSAF